VVKVKADNKPAAKAEIKTEVKADQPKPKKLSYKEQRELEELPKLIAKLEAEQAAISAKLADPALYQNNADEVVALNKRFEEIDTLLLESLEKWEQIEGRN
jgi:ATP-binding cassette subfamily F protein uup